MDQSDSDSAESWTILEHSSHSTEDVSDFSKDPIERYINIYALPICLLYLTPYDGLIKSLYFSQAVSISIDWLMIAL